MSVRHALAAICVVLCFLVGCASFGTSTGKGFIWSPETGPTHAGHFRCVAFGDLNRDGNLDLVAGSFLPGGVSVWLGDGNGGWRPVPGPSVGGDVRAVAVGDINGDGRPDLMVGGQQDLKGVLVFLQEADGSWRKGPPPVELGSYETIKCVDVNGDGNLDIVGANCSGEQEGGIQVWLGDGRGNWKEEVGPDTSNIYRDVDVVDVDGDGHLDLVAAAWGHPGGIHIFRGNGYGGWSDFPSPEREGDFWGITAKDLNGDGLIDIAATTYYKGIKVWSGDGKGGWCRIHFPVNTGFYWDVLAADFNHDNRIDLAATSVSTGGVRIWMGVRPDGWLSPAKQLSEDGSFYGLSSIDVDGDGHEDLAAASYSEGVQVWLGGRKDAGSAATGPEKAPEALKSKPYRAVTRFGVPFEANGVKVSDAGESVLAEAVRLLRSSKKIESVRVEGHAESGEKGKGTDSPMALSEARAEKVRQLLAEQVPLRPEKISAIGFADSRSVPTELKDKGVTNRRVDVVVTHLRSVDDHLTPGREDQKRQNDFMANQSMGEYRIGPGDVLKVVFWKQFSADEYEVLVRPDGTLSFSMVDDLKVSGLTLTELDHLLTKRLSRYFKNPRVDILIKEHHSQQVLLLGAINSLVRQPTGPGVYTLAKPTRIVELVTVAGGPKPTANLKKVAITRKNGTTLYVNLYKAIFQSDFSQNIQVLPGDSIFIPETSEGVSKVYVLGEVKNPGVFDLKEGMSVLQAIGKAGSFTKDAVVRDVRLIRGDISKPEVIPVNFKRFFRTGDFSSNLALQNNDVIYVPKTTVASMSNFLGHIKPALDFILFPYQFEALRTTIDLNRQGVRPLESK